MWSHALSISTVIFLKDPPSFLAFVLGQITIPGNTSLFGHSLHRSSGTHLLGAREAPGGILGSLGSPRGYASVYHIYICRAICGRYYMKKIIIKNILNRLKMNHEEVSPVEEKR